jgi:hypothetical protein
MNALKQYLDLIVEPTVDEFRKNPTSLRHAYLACVAAYHAVDRVSYPEHPQEVTKEWRQKCDAFALVELVALDFKHVKSSKHKLKAAPPRIPIGMALYGHMGFNTHMLNDTGQVDSLYHLSFMADEALRFLYQQADAMELV